KIVRLVVYVHNKLGKDSIVKYVMKVLFVENVYLSYANLDYVTNVLSVDK
ncbi:unnamed protein product, partial [marine sediment metagenome]